jgi:alcohol dehydrogenase class IV
MRGDYMLKFQVSTNLRFGVGESEKLGEEIQNLGYGKTAVICDQKVINHPQVEKAVKGINAHFDIFKNEAAEPTYDYLELFKKKLINKNYDCLIGIGGGSTIDLAKGQAVLLTNEGSAISFRGFPKLKNKPLPVIAIPTTAGSGSEATYNAVFTDAKEKKKLGINSTYNFPVCAIIDPLLTLDCPESVTASSGADALVHTLESFVHKNYTSLSRMYSKQAFGLLFNNLKKVLDNPKDIEIRANIALGAYLAGIALINAGSGPAGAFSYPLGAVYKVSHGYAGAIFLPSITKINVEKGYSDYVQLYDLIEGADRNLSIKEKNVVFAQKIQELMAELKIPLNLGYYKLAPSDIEFMIDQYDVLKNAIYQNPVEITKDDSSKMIRELV